MFHFSKEQLNKLYELKKIIKENISFILLLPTLLGGLTQMIELLKISPSLIRFFSISQLISDGIFILFYFLIIVFLPYLLTKIFFDYKLSKRNQQEIFKYRIPYAIFLIIFATLCIKFEDFYNRKLSYLFIVHCLLFFVVSFGVHLIFKLTHFRKKTSISIIDEKVFISLYLIVAGIVLSIVMFQKVSYETPIDNFEIVKSKYKNEGKVDILYFNDKYIFLETECNKMTKKIHIEEINSIFE